MKLDELFNIINEAVDGEEIRGFAREYRQYPLKLSYTSFSNGMSWLADFYKSQGLDAEFVTFPADGHTVYADRHFPYAWDIYEAWAKVGDKEIAQYEENTYCVVPFSADSDGEQERVFLKYEDSKDVEDLSPYAILITDFPDMGRVREISAKGCTAFFSTVDTEPIDPSLEDSRRWYNDLFGAGQMDYRDKATCCGFSITPRIARDLLAQMKEGEVKVRYCMHTKTYESTYNACTAVVPGEDDRCFIVSAHGYEPHATNNVAGIAMSMGAAKALSSLIASGKLPKPKHSIRFFHGLENFSLYAWGMQNCDKMKNALGGTSIDSFGRYGAGGWKEHFVLRRCLNVHPSDQHALAREILGKVCASRGIDFETREASKNNEDLMQDNEFGPAWNLLYGSLWEEPRETYPRCYFYHTSVDTAENLSPEMLSAAAVYSAVLAYYVACGDEEDELKAIALEDWKRYTDDKCREALRLADEDAESRMLRAQRLLTWKPLAIASAGKALECAELTKTITNYINAQVTAAVKTLCGADGSPAALSIDDDKARLVIKRTVPGPIGLGTISDELREKAAKILGYYSNEYWVLEECGTNPYYFDGKRTLFDVAKAVWATRMYGEHEDKEGFAKEYAFYKGIAEILLEAGEAVEVSRMTVTKDDIKKTLADLGIKAGDKVMVHSSLKALGNVAGGAQAVIEALTETVTEKGIVAMPAFTDCTDGGSRPPFDPAETSTEAWIGSIPEAFRKYPGVKRSQHPTHSVSAWGEGAEEFISQNDPYDCFANDGPWARIAEEGKLVFIGETMGSNTFLHACEKWFGGYLDETFGVIKTADGPKKVRVTNYPSGCRGGWYKLGRNAEYFKKLDAKGVYKTEALAEGAITAAIAADVKAGMKEIMTEDPYILLHKCGCLDCARMRAKRG